VRENQKETMDEKPLARQEVTDPRKWTYEELKLLSLGFNHCIKESLQQKRKLRITSVTACTQ